MSCTSLEMKFEITLAVEDCDGAPSQHEMKEAFLEWLSYRNPYDERRHIENAKVVAKREAA